MNEPSREAPRKPAWRAIEELAGGPELDELLRREFPDQAAEWTDPVTRRQFLTLLGASLALAGVSGCSSKPAPPELIMPYVRQPEGLVPGKPLFYATAMPLSGIGTGLLVTSHEGRPTKVEGNPQHPASLGATDVFAQASVLGLYDPDRSQSVTYRGEPRGWNEALTALRVALAGQGDSGGAGLRILTGAVSSPALADLLTGDHAGSLRKVFPEARWCRHEPAVADTVAEGTNLAFGKRLHPVYDFENADVVLSLDADFLSCGPAHLRYVRQFVARRRPWGKPGQPTMNRLYVAEATPSTTGAAADHRLPVRAGEVERIARALAAELGVAGVRGSDSLSDAARKWVRAAAADLRDKHGRSAMLAGDGQPAYVHALAHVLNAVLENVGKTVSYITPAAVPDGPNTVDLGTLVGEMADGKVKVLLVLGSNPVFTAPVDLEFEEQLDKVPLRIHLGLYQDETAVRCHWHIPEAHYLESWGDVRAFDGTVTIMQPLIEPLYGGRSALEFLSAVLGDSERPGYEIVRGYWSTRWPKRSSTGAFERDWEKALHDGFMADSTAEAEKSVAVKMGWQGRPEPPAPAADDLEIVFRPDPGIHDGRFANNGWLQEWPRPLTRLTWDNAALVSPATAQKLGLTQTAGLNGGEHGQAIVDLVELNYAGRTIRAPAWIMPGHADDCVTIHFGHGRTHAGSVGTGTGFNAYRIRTAAAPWFGTGLRIRKTGETYTLACVQMHHAMQGREPVRIGTLHEFRENRNFLIERENEKEQRYQRELVPGPVGQESRPEKARENGHPDPEERDRRLHPLTLYTHNDFQTPRNRWAMAIDLTSCVGCGACVVACQAENNIPVVGKTEVTRGREMHWLRIDRYYTGELDNPEAWFQPVPCMQCENAPCELVCPVGATVHSDDGLNDMVYNRCVGTRYCSNNCPYKVRRFNFLKFADFATESFKLGRNPDVTVRSRGVMEKCTYCVQRIRRTMIDAEVHDREVRDGDIATACQAACPARAIVFGDLNDPKSRVSRMKTEPLHYGLLAELNTRPRTTYLAALRNPNPELA